MANHHKIAMWVDGNKRLNLYYEDSLTGEFDTWLIYDSENGWQKTVHNEIDSDDEEKWFKLESVENVADELVTLLNSLTSRVL